MKFVLVNGRTPRTQSFCALCCESIGESYLRDIATQLSYCNHKCLSAADRSWIQARLQRRGRDGRKHMRGAVSATFRRPAISSSFVKSSSVVPTSAWQEELRTAFITLSGTGRLIAVDWPRAGLLLHDPQLETLPSARLRLGSGFDQSSVGANRVQCPIAAGFLGELRQPIRHA